MSALTIDDAKRAVKLSDRLAGLRDLAKEVSAASEPVSCDFATIKHDLGMSRPPTARLRFEHLVEEWRDLVAREAALQIAAIEAELIGIGIAVVRDDRAA